LPIAALAVSDVGAKGSVAVSGTLAHPALSRGLDSTDGTLSTPQGEQQSFALALDFSEGSAMQLTLFKAASQARTLGVQTPFTPTGPTNYQLQALAPTPGTSGYVFTYVRRFP
jgi:hypothetical protein